MRKGFLTMSRQNARVPSLNARFGAVTLALSALMILALSCTSSALTPIRSLTLAATVVAIWAFCDEMGLKKPLNRAGFVFFTIASAAKMQVLLGVGEAVVGGYYLLYAAFLLLAVLLWSLAFLHRQREVKIIGAAGAFAALIPIILIVVGHLAVGVGAAIGLSGLLSATQAAPSDLTFVTMVERIFGIWGSTAAWLLWRAQIVAPLKDQEHATV
jgi:hypothetical protein